MRMGSKDSYWSDILDNGSLCCYRSGAMPIEAHISQRLLTRLTPPTPPSGGTRTSTRCTSRPSPPATRRNAPPSTSACSAACTARERLPHLGDSADWIIGTARGVKGVDAEAPANTLDWARFDTVWLA
ncbi:hypothetical protein GCM10023238_06520 [Streptomyces heliomycini]